jgi:Cu+-exporting ATPase
MSKISNGALCYHCGEPGSNLKLSIGDKAFCCQGCRSVYLLLNEHQLDNYYCLNERPGVQIKEVQPEKFSFLDEEHISSQLLSFRNEEMAQVTFSLPQIHCSSCLWLLEHLATVHPGIIVSRVNFNSKELFVSFRIKQLSLRALADLLMSIGYEPHISLDDVVPGPDASEGKSRSALYKLGITGFCFANIMLISFPEYLGLHPASDGFISSFFRGVNLVLSLPVVFYGAAEFFRNAWYSFRQRYLNIDAPIALAVAVTFIRSLYEIGTGAGPGYLDSMSGIVFFMLLGRTLQNRTYSQMKFTRDYKSYFPIAVNVLKGGTERATRVQDIREKDILLLRHLEVVPVDCLLSKGKAELDYSFITGESNTQFVRTGALIYAGAKVSGSAIEVMAVKNFDQNTFTRLWNNEAFRKESSDKGTMTALISKYFSLAVIIIALSAFLYWINIDAGKAWKALTSVLIVACPCALLLTTTFTNGYLLEYFSAHGFFLKNAGVIERLSGIDHIAFDKTGTITETNGGHITMGRMTLSREEKETMLAMIAQSNHPLNRALVKYYRYHATGPAPLLKEIPGKGLEAWVDDRHYKIGSAAFTCGDSTPAREGSELLVAIDGKVKAHYLFSNHIKAGIPELIPSLSSFSLSLVSGDNESSRRQMRDLFPPGTPLLFRQSPQDKLQHVMALQQAGLKVLMAGDGLNDAGALQQSDVGIAVVQRSFSFSPASDAILRADRLQYLPAFLSMSRSAQNLILLGFIYSVLFNIIGIGFAVTAHLSPVVAAILMPSSSLGIMLIAFLGILAVSRRNDVPVA